MSTPRNKTANDTGDWQNNKEKNPGVDTTGVEESTAGDVYKNDTGDPGRTPGSAEGVENPEEDGNE